MIRSLPPFDGGCCPASASPVLSDAGGFLFAPAVPWFLRSRNADCSALTAAVVNCGFAAEPSTSVCVLASTDRGGETTGPRAIDSDPELTPQQERHRVTRQKSTQAPAIERAAIRNRRPRRLLSASIGRQPRLPRQPFQHLTTLRAQRLRLLSSSVTFRAKAANIFQFCARRSAGPRSRPLCRASDCASDSEPELSECSSALLPPSSSSSKLRRTLVTVACAAALLSDNPQTDGAELAVAPRGCFCKNRLAPDAPSSSSVAELSSASLSPPAPRVRTRSLTYREVFEPIPQGPCGAAESGSSPSESDSDDSPSLLSSVSVEILMLRGAVTSRSVSATAPGADGTSFDVARPCIVGWRCLCSACWRCLCSVLNDCRCRFSTSIRS